ncbi:type ii/iv secretion system atp hydrolase tada/virb11/cpaf, tada subfamily [hydrocarbon metagenome]|uniref:Type ii/iv secretion system atp hydrolase tada/virb11/cpaf, tada subfamily n=1 Tax=hydrocarbon metagenome TaxID=938273 RepID=A0A0W8E7P8_9ZZZZ
MSLLARLQNDQVITPNTKKETASSRYLEIVYQIHREIIREIGQETFNSKGREETENRIRSITDLIIENDYDNLPRSEREVIIKQVTDEVLEFGPLSPLLRDETISEIMVNGPKQVFVERRGKIERVNVVFRDDLHLHTVIERIISPLGRRLDESMPMVDARLPDGSRVNAIIPPLAINGCVLTIRKFSKNLLKTSDLIRNNSMTSHMSKFLEACVKGRMSIIVSGGTGAGKTSTLNIISGFIPHDERIITIEDSAELVLNQDHVVTLETRPSNVDGKGEISIRDLVRNSLRMRPDRIVVGEVRGGEALDMLQAMNTGHDGSLSTAHANSPRDALARLETMVLMAGMEMPMKAIREQIASAIDFIVHQSRLSDGTRKITHITEVVGMETDIITLQDIFIFDQTGVDERGRVQGRHRATGIKPKCLDKLRTAGIVIPDEFFA